MQANSISFRLVLAILGCGLLGGKASRAADAPMTLEQLVKLHDATMSKFQSVAVRVKYTQQGSSSDLMAFREEWRKQGAVERITALTQYKPQNPNRYGTTLLDVELDRDRNILKSMWISDPLLLNQIEVADQRTLRASETPLSRTLKDVSVYSSLLIQIRIADHDEYRTFGEIVKEARHAQLIGSETTDDGKNWIVEVEHPGIGGKIVGTPIRIHLDSRAGFLIREVRVASLKPRQGSRIGAPDDFQFVRKVLKFRALPGGIFFPETAESYLQYENGRTYGDTQIDVEEMRINERLPDSDLRVRFPKNALVSLAPDAAWHFEEDPPKVDLALIGDDGERVRVFAKDSDDLEKLKQSLPSTQKTPQKSAPVSEEQVDAPTVTVESLRSGSRLIKWLSAIGFFVWFALTVGVVLWLRLRR